MTTSNAEPVRPWHKDPVALTKWITEHSLPGVIDQWRLALGLLVDRLCDPDQAFGVTMHLCELPVNPPYPACNAYVIHFKFSDSVLNIGLLLDKDSKIFEVVTMPADMVITGGRST